MIADVWLYTATIMVAGILGTLISTGSYASAFAVAGLIVLCGLVATVWAVLYERKQVLPDARRFREYRTALEQIEELVNSTKDNDIRIRIRGIVRWTLERELEVADYVDPPLSGP